MLSCGALEKSNNPYIEPIVEPCVSKNQKEIFTIWKENPEKGLRLNNIEQSAISRSSLFHCKIEII